MKASKLINDKETTEALEWLRFVLNEESPMPTVSDWQRLYDFANKQKIVGICNPGKYDIKMDEEVLFRWLNTIQKTRSNSTKLNLRTTELYKMLKKDGFRCCILKGQGNAEMYPEPLMRCPGDIDVWIDAAEQDIFDYAHSRYPEAENSFKHIKFPVFKDVPVDVHHTPLKLYNPIHNKRLQQWLNAQKAEQFDHFVKLSVTNSEICAPTAKFNAVYQLGHILIHLQDEGIGFRHFIDYYYVIKSLGNLAPEERSQIVNVWKRLGMQRLASAMMWILHHVLGLHQDCLLVEPNEEFGKTILNEALEGGNFGKYSKRRDFDKYGFLAQKFIKARHLLQLSRCYPSETPFRLFSKMTTAIRVAKQKII